MSPNRMGDVAEAGLIGLLLLALLSPFLLALALCRALNRN